MYDTKPTKCKKKKKLKLLHGQLCQQRHWSESEFGPTESSYTRRRESGMPKGLCDPTQSGRKLRRVQRVALSVPPERQAGDWTARS